MLVLFRLGGIMSHKSQVRLNAEADPYYRPYCLRCSTMVRMQKIGEMIWRCTSCGAEHDENKRDADDINSKVTT